MKRSSLISPLVLLSGLLFVMFLLSCGKDGNDGLEGPEGPAGPKGDNGVGAAAVYYSDWLDVKYKVDTIHRSGGRIDTVGYFASINVPKLTPALLSTADVKAFINRMDASEPVNYPLPYYAQSGLYIEFITYAQTISLYSSVDMSTYLAGGKRYNQYRYMIVPGNTHARSAVNWSDYASVKAHLGLKD